MEPDVPEADIPLLYDKYQHEPLIAEDAVRVLVLEPADQFESPLRCSITQRRRDKQSHSASGCDYSAVSYTWGDGGFSHQLFVRVDGQSWQCLQITTSVDSLLRYFRLPYKARLLWLDAICLDQKDETEKTQQIPLMGRIYSDAKRVRIWLGDDEVDKAQQAFAIIRATERENQWKPTKGDLQCLADLFNRPWFTRRWVIQEALFSHDAVFHCGFHTLGLSRVMAALRAIQSAGDHDVVGYGARMLLSSFGSRHISKKGLLSLLWDLHESECVDPRDRVAAVYALVTDGAIPSLRYGSRNWKEIYMDVASYFISKTSESHIIPSIDMSQAVLLHLCSFGPIGSETDTDYPSWIPDWSRRRKELPYSPDEPSLYSFDNPLFSRFLQLNRQWFSSRPLTGGRRWQQYCSFFMGYSARCMTTKVVGTTLRLHYHPLVFFQHCGVADLVIHSSTGPGFWNKVVEAWETPAILRQRPAETDRDSLLMLLAQMLVKRDEAADKAPVPWDKYTKDRPAHSEMVRAYTKEIRKGLHAHRENSDTLSASNKLNLQYIRSSLRHLSIMRIRAIAGSYWAIGPPNSQIRDWVVPVLLSERSGFVPMMCLRRINSMGAEIRGGDISSVHASSMAERCRRYFLDETSAEVDCLHVKAKFVGPASHCDQTPLQPEKGGKEYMLDIIKQASEAAWDKGLPGAIVFDIV